MLITMLNACFYSSTEGRSQGRVVSAGMAKNEVPGTRTTKEEIPEKTSEERTPLQELQETTPNPWTLDDDVRALEEKYGTLQEGQTLEISLHELLEICPRNRRKSDAFKGLISHLKAKDVVLRIYSTTKRNESL